MSREKKEKLLKKKNIEVMFITIIRGNITLIVLI